MDGPAQRALGVVPRHPHDSMLLRVAHTPAVGGRADRGTTWLVDALRLDKGGIAYWWRSRDEPVGNHLIRDPVRFWSLDGTDEAVLAALRERRFTDLPRRTSSPAETRRRIAVELDRSLSRLRATHEAYWDRNWRREHRGNGRYPENHLWDAVDGYLDLMDAGNRLDE